MRVTTDSLEFRRQVKIISGADKIKELGLEACCVIGSFYPSEIDDVLHFCAENPKFHIVSYMGKGIYINRYHEKGLGFRLAEGDAAPDFMLDLRGMHCWMLPDLHPKAW